MVVAGKINTVSDIEWPNLTVLRACFDDYKFDTMDKYNDIEIIEMFNYTNPVTYDVDDESVYGPLLSIDMEMELHKKHNIPYDEGLNDLVRFRENSEISTINQLVSKYEQEEKDLIQVESWQLM